MIPKILQNDLKKGTIVDLQISVINNPEIERDRFQEWAKDKIKNLEEGK